MQKEARITVRYRPEERELLEQVAGSRHGDLSRFIRSVTVDAAMRRKARQEADR